MTNGLVSTPVTSRACASSNSSSPALPVPNEDFERSTCGEIGASPSADIVEERARYSETREDCFQSQIAGSRNRSAMWPPDHCWRLARAGRTSGRDVIERPEERRSKVDPVQRPKTATAFGVKSVQDLKL
jgi:hypothetical protein